MKTYIWPTGTWKNTVCECAPFWLFATLWTVFHIGNYYRNANQNNSEVPPHASQNSHYLKNLQTINAGEGVEKREPFYTIGGHVSWYSHYGYRDSFKK